MMKKRIIISAFLLTTLLTTTELSVLAATGSTGAVSTGTVQTEQASQLPQPIARVEKMQVNIKSASELDQAIQNALAACATTLEINANGDCYQSLVQKLALYAGDAQLQNYNAYLVRGYRVQRTGNKYQIIFERDTNIAKEMYVDAAVAQLIPALQKPDSYDTIVSVHDFICNQAVYSWETFNGTAQYYTAYDVLTAGTSICSGYALMFQKFMDEMGIPCYIATDNDHAWNIVQLNGAWYHIDCTWDAKKANGTKASRRYCLKGQTSAGYPAWGNIILSPADAVKK